MRPVRPSAFLQGAACGALAVALSALAATTPRAADKPPVAVTFHNVNSLEWMAGGWSRTVGDRTTEEHWLPPSGGAMLGMHRDISDGKMTSYEFIRIVSEPGGIFYIASPNGAEPVRFRMSESSAKRAVFANRDHDFPKRILYWIDPDGAMHARVEGDDPASGQEWVWDRIAPAAAAR